MVNTFLLEVDKLNDDTIFSKYYNHMSPYRKNKIDRLKQRKDKNLSLAVGIIIDSYLQKFNLRECDMNYSTKTNGKPFFTDYEHLYFNASHSGNVAICAFSDNEIGCDIQQITKAKEKVAKRFLTNNEYNYIYNKNVTDITQELSTDEKFTRLWAVKESYLKLIGSGLGGGLQSFDIIIENNVIKIGENNCYIKEYRYKDYYIELCSAEPFFNDKLEILTL